MANILRDKEILETARHEAYSFVGSGVAGDATVRAELMTAIAYIRDHWQRRYGLIQVGEMRVIGGVFRSRRLESLPGLSTRPTPDRMRETLFNILQPVLEGCIFVDAYAGTGAVGIEAISRGASKAIFLERNPAAVAVIRENLKSLSIGPDRGRVIPGAATAGLSMACDVGNSIVFLDPPYEKTSEYESSLSWLGSHAPTIVIVQHPSKFDAGERHGRLERYRTVKQGDNSLSFYRAETTQAIP